MVLGDLCGDSRVHVVLGGLCGLGVHVASAVHMVLVSTGFMDLHSLGGSLGFWGLHGFRSPHGLGYPHGSEVFIFWGALVVLGVHVAPGIRVVLGILELLVLEVPSSQG